VLARKILITCIALVFTFAACVPAEEDNDRIPNFDPEDNIMGQIQEDGELRIGIEGDASPWSSSEGGAVQGFNVDLGLLVADALGVEAEFLVAEREELPAMVADGDVHLAFPLVPTTEEFLIDHGLTDPYFVAHQRLLVPEDSGIEGVEDLDGRDVCSLANEDTGADVELLNPDVGEVVTTSDERECLRLLNEGRVDAVVGPDILLLAVAEDADGTVVVGDQLTTEGYGAVVSRGTGGFDGYVDGIFAEADKELEWTELYRKWISPITGEEPPPFPTMNLEEAAALFPAGG
jgi:ABC-type amino acid transport substrate-binding protein